MATSAVGMDKRLAQWVEDTKFRTTRGRRGYDMQEVDALLDEIVGTFLGRRNPPLAGADIRAAVFQETRLREGYNTDDVDEFLDRVELRLEQAVPQRLG